VEPSPRHASFRFYAELNDHLLPDQRYRTLEKPFFVPGTVKDMIESFGVPHTEIDLIIANGRSVDFSYTVRHGDRISVYPVFESIDITPELRIRPQPLRNPKFVLDVHLGRLAAYLRMLGFDAEYRRDASDAELVDISSGERRILLTRDRGLLRHSAVTHGYWLRETDSRRQTAEVISRFDLKRSMRPFSRCMACNGAIRPVSQEEALHRLGARRVGIYDEFRQCPDCRRIYWKGSHYVRMQRWIDRLVSGTGDMADG